MKKAIILIAIAIITLIFILVPLNVHNVQIVDNLENVPQYTNQAYVVINNNVPELSKEDGSKEFEIYSDLDGLGRCGTAYANLSKKTMPTGKRENISSVKPTGWVQSKYKWIDGEKLYNRCHLIGYQLAGENANRKNLITGTRYLNTVGMLPFENEVAEYIKETGNHVLYKVSPHFTDYNLVADGVHMQALSVEDDGLAFNIYCYNVQPGVVIDYKTGANYGGK